MANRYVYEVQMAHNEMPYQPLTVTLWAATDQEACRKAEEDNPDYHWVSCESTGACDEDPAEATTEEIITALRICGDEKRKCADCPFKKRGIKCGEELSLMAADLIERLTKNA
ncbi:MAG: hypothetical protein IJI06_08770 [Oscillospiraceae bacterium]|nr:hypothetical protein [Oscillospiraceae bacterium]